MENLKERIKSLISYFQSIAIITYMNEFSAKIYLPVSKYNI